MSNQAPQYDFSDEYITEEVDLGTINGFPFVVTVQEIPHGKYTKLQQDFIGKMHLTDSEKAHQKQLEEKEVDPIQYVENRNFAGIRKWTLKTKSGEDIPVCPEAWVALPHRLTEKIEKAIVRVNPTMDKDFRDKVGEAENTVGVPNPTP